MPPWPRRVLRADDQAVEHVVVGRRSMVIRLTDMPASQVLAVEDRSEALRNLRTWICRLRRRRRRRVGALSGLCRYSRDRAAQRRDAEENCSGKNQESRFLHTVLRPSSDGRRHVCPEVCEVRRRDTSMTLGCMQNAI